MNEACNTQQGDFEFFGGGSDVQISDENVEELVDSMLGGVIEDYEKRKADGDRYALSVRDFDIGYLKEISRHDMPVLIRDQSGKVVGFGGVEKMDWPDYRGRSIVLPEARKRGFSRELVRRLIEKGDAKWSNSIMAASSRNPIVKEMCPSMGFVSVGMKKGDVLNNTPQSRSNVKHRIMQEVRGRDFFVRGISPDEIDLGDLRTPTLKESVTDAVYAGRNRIQGVFDILKKRLRP